MAIGDSGRIVIEIEPDIKKRLYACLALEQMSLKEWFLNRAEQHIKAEHPELLPKKQKSNK
jgi:hypothetical protein